MRRVLALLDVRRGKGAQACTVSSCKRPCICLLYPGPWPKSLPIT